MPIYLAPESLRFDDGRPQVKVDPETGCWIWQGTKMRGYGRVRRGKRASVQAHKVIYERVFDTVPTRLRLGHTCGRRSCVFYGHVRPVTETENNAERYQIPHLGASTLGQIEEYLQTGWPDRAIAYEIGISCWFVRRLRKYQGQYSFTNIGAL